MLRFISFLLFLAGLVAAWLGISVFTGNTQWLPNIGGEPAIDAAAPEGWTVEAAPEVAAIPEPVMAEPTPAPVEAPPAKTKPTKAAPPKASAEKNVKAPAMAEPSTRGLEAAPDTAMVQPQLLPPGPDAPTAAPTSIVSDTAAAPVKSVQELFADTLRTVPVAHQTPQKAAYKRSFNVTLALDGTGDSSAKDVLTGDGRIVEGTAKVSNTVKAELSGASFKIVENSPATQALSPVSENVWRWSVTPQEIGTQPLTFDLFAIDGDVATPLRTYSDSVEVEVSGISRAISFADQANPIAVFLGGLGSMIAGLFGVFRFFRGKGG